VDDLTDVRRRGGGLALRLALKLAVAPLMIVVAATPPAGAQPTPPPQAEAAAQEGRFTGIAALHDNDGLPNVGNTFRDDNYSAGIALRVSGRAIRDWRLTAPLEGLDWLTRVSSAHRRAALASHSLAVVGAAYTPNDLVAVEPQRDDRPFASLFGITLRRQTVAHGLEQSWTSELTVGALGLDAARAVQSFLHRTRRWMTGNPVPPDPRGWPNQISDGGEPTALYRVAVDRRLAGAGAGPLRKRWQLTGGLEGSLGFQTTLAGTLTVRAGAFTTEFWEFASGILSPGLGRQVPAAARWEAFVFGAARPRVVAYNALLQGQFRSSVHTVRPRRVVGEWEGGLGLGGPLGGYQVQMLVGLAQGRSTEWIGDRATPSTWGTVSIVVSRPGR